MGDKIIIDGHRIAVCGGRDYDRRDVVEWALGLLVPTPIEFKVNGVIYLVWPVLVHGDASGADTLAADWALGRDMGVEAHPADWDVHGRAAGPIRNQEMAESGLDLLVAFPGGRGTADMIRRCRANDVRVVEVGDKGPMRVAT